MTASPLPSLDDLFDRFYVDSTSPTGLRWARQVNSRALKDQPAGSLTGRYYSVYIQGQKFSCHRVITAMRTGVDRLDMEVDHVDRNRLNNHPFNLRWASRSQQMRNKSNWGKCLPGVYRERANLSKPFRASVFRDGRQLRLGRYATEEEAHQAYMNFFYKEDSK